jgi:predicted secreted protein
MFKKILSFFLCFIRDDCEYSIKKVIATIFVGVAIYLMIWTDKSAYEALGFAAVLLGLRTYEKGKEMTLGRKFGTKPPETKRKILND